MFNNKKKKHIARLLESFGKPKDEHFSFELIRRYFDNANHAGAYQVISEKTSNDLDVNEIFKYADRTNSKIGQQYLYNQLRVIPQKTCFTKHEEQLIDNFRQNSEYRTKLQLLLEKLDNTGAYYITSLFQEPFINPPKWFFIVPILFVSSIVLFVLSSFYPKLVIVLIAVFLANFVIHYWNKKNVDQYLSSIPQLLRLQNITKTLTKDININEIDPKISKATSSIESIRKNMLFFQLESKIQSDIEALFWSFMELLKILFILEPILLFDALKKLDKKQSEIEKIFCFVGKIDMLISVASLREGTTHCISAVTNDNKLVAKQLYHPLINDCVKNDVSVNGKSILLTGSNMSGKTTFIRTVGVNVLTGLTLNTCFSDEIILPKSRIFSAIRISDDLLNDKSYYFEEVLTIKEMIDESRLQKPTLFLLDEIYKGTNTVERISAGKSVLSFLSKGNNLVFVSTHDIELTYLLENEYELYHFSETVNQNNVDFDYKLKPGRLTNRNAIRILQINNYPETIISEAMKTASEMDRKK